MAAEEPPSAPTASEVSPFRQATDAAAQPARLRLDELLNELVERAGEVLATQGRLRGLLDSVVFISEGRSVAEVLTRLVKSACELAGAKYGALGIIAASGDRLDDFITAGFDAETIDAIGNFPSGQGLLGSLITDPQPIRLMSLGSDPRSVGLPANHPEMTTFLGVPLQVRGLVFGNLYLTEKVGADEFSAEDQQLVVALAAAGSIAVRNAQLFAEQQRRERWAEATTKVSIAALSGTAESLLLSLITDTAKSAAGADVSILLSRHDDDELHVTTATGPLADGLIDHPRVVSNRMLEKAIQAPEPVVVDDPGSHALAAALGIPAAVARFVLIPIISAGSSDDPAESLLLLGFQHVSSTESGDPVPLSEFAQQVAVAVSLARAQSERARLALLEDRDRIARDLHDLVIQRLFATGMSLQSVERFIDDPEASQRMTTAVDDLDTTIKEVRQVIYQLQAEERSGSVRAAVQSVVDESLGNTDLVVRLQIVGVLEAIPLGGYAEHLLAVLRESLTNVVRHAGASHVSVTIDVGSSLLLSVVDDGRGIGQDSARQSGLANMRNRALELGGGFEVTSPTGGGTQVTWHVPLNSAD